jgi:hypothetical protein
MKKIIDIDFTNFKLPSVVFFCQQPTVPSRQQIQLPNTNCCGPSSVDCRL